MILQALESHGDVFNMHTFIIIRQYMWTETLLDSDAAFRLSVSLKYLHD